METTIISLDTMKCLSIVKTAIVKPYNASSADSPLFGKHYRIYSYLGKGFAVNTESDFNADFDKGDIDNVQLEETADGYSFLSHVTITRAERAHFTMVKRKAITVEFIQNSKIMDLEELA